MVRPLALRPLRRADGSFYVPLARLGRRDAAAVRGGARIGIGSLSYRGRGPTLGRDPIFGPLGTSPVGWNCVHRCVSALYSYMSLSRSVPL